MSKKITIQNLEALEVFSQWGKVSVETESFTNLVLNIEGSYDRFSVKVYPNGKTMFNRDAYQRCFGNDTSLHMYELLDTISLVFDTECYDVTNTDNQESQIVAV